jgi:hypothetical protein
MEPEALLEKLKFARDHPGDIERMAVLSDRVWIKSWVKELASTAINQKR